VRITNRELLSEPLLPEGGQPLRMDTLYSDTIFIMLRALYRRLWVQILDYQNKTKSVYTH